MTALFQSDNAHNGICAATVNGRQGGTCADLEELWQCVGPEAAAVLVQQLPQLLLHVGVHRHRARGGRRGRARRGHRHGTLRRGGQERKLRAGGHGFGLRRRGFGRGPWGWLGGHAQGRIHKAIHYVVASWLLNLWNRSNISTNEGHCVILQTSKY